MEAIIQAASEEDRRRLLALSTTVAIAVADFDNPPLGSLVMVGLTSGLAHTMSSRFPARSQKGISGLIEKAAGDGIFYSVKNDDAMSSLAVDQMINGLGVDRAT